MTATTAALALALYLAGLAAAFGARSWIPLRAVSYTHLRAHET